MKIFTFILCLFLSLEIAYTQNFALVDKTVSKYPSKFKSIKQFSNRVDEDFNTDLDKIRAVYFWISNNITYDYKSLKNNTNGYKKIKSKSKDDYEIRFLNMQKKYAERALKRKLAVCEGYSQLLKFTLIELDIETEVITGFAKSKAYEIGRITNRTNHAWNAVKINDTWKLIDATWSAGKEERSDREYDFTDIFFLIKPEKLILTHLPKDEKWQLLEKPISKANYFFKPLFYEAYHKSGLKLSQDQLGLIKLENNDFIEIKFDSINKIDDNYYYSFLGSNSSKRLFFKEKDGKFVTKIPVKSNRKTVLAIHNHFYTVLEFMIINQN
ncbi:transglutaminase domain-containing protein [Psychroserpens sp. Hel_I_66]|uniref:transglutaminase domain-containing protein n=1 Tax=Psychroserpens sp. Hel_I_66 TaxID=1250004 RepID=UPI00064658C8|nr:transglutaminase domain-containing protein [Psychroserpens sp. Hel_I_66]